MALDTSSGLAANFHRDMLYVVSVIFLWRNISLVGAGVVGLSEPLFPAIHDVEISVAFLALELLKALLRL